MMGFTVSLNGNNYMSEKRKSAFEQALEEGQQMSDGGNGQKPAALEQHKPEKVYQTAAPNQTTRHDAQPSLDYTRVFETLELGLKQSYGHQSETLRVHQQYLSNQAEYASIFSQLMQQQGELFSNGNTSPEKSEITLTVLRSLAQSIEQFHQHQAQTLTVHNQFLHQQSTYAQAFVDLLRQQTVGSNGGAGKVNMGINPQQYDAPAPSLDEQPVSVELLPEMLAPAVPVRESVVDIQPQVIDPVEKAPPAPVKGDVIDTDTINALLLSIVSDKTGYPSEMLELDMDMEADLGIDSIKRVEIMGALQDQVSDFPEIDTEVLAEMRTLAQIISYIRETQGQQRTAGNNLSSVSSATSVISSQSDLAPVQEYAFDFAAMKSTLLNIVSDKTGYPAEMLELDMDMEADLGIDSIKRVEILGALQDTYPQLPDFGADTLNDLRTLQQIISYIDGQRVTEKKV
ncbi:MAG: phosphopantetheine-binding protein [Anaerolineae bacterium]|nr:phosphopantetheine-binding protein [Anaerolineae bacterium]